MAYEDFSHWYDALNPYADYPAYARHITDFFKSCGLHSGLVLDLGCGTGECTLRLAKAGYEMIGVDASADMLSVLREKLARPGAPSVLLLCQPLEALDLYGTVQGAVSTFDTLSHIPPEHLAQVLGRAALFMEPGSPFVFDVNTVYKHRQVLGNHPFTLEGDGGVACRWTNRLIVHEGWDEVEMELVILRGGRPQAREVFSEYAYPLEHWRGLLAGAGFRVLGERDGDTFGPPGPETQRLLFETRKERNL